MADEIQLNTSLKANDIVFDCPHCGKNLAIDERGAGMDITCPDCQNTIQVPTQSANDTDAELARELEGATGCAVALTRAGSGQPRPPNNKVLAGVREHVRQK